MRLSRRSLLRGGGAAVLAAACPFRVRPARAGGPIRLRPAPGSAALLGEAGPRTAVWCFNEQVPGPELRLRQGERLEVELENGLAQDTTVHWHGLRIPHAMDGVPYLTQAPVRPGERFAYAFEAPDAGTFWYHPHVRGSEQQGRGLYGALIVEEPEPPAVDRDLVWVIDDWRLTEAGGISETFGQMMDLSHAGRLGNLATLNGRDSGAFPVRAGERLRLRLINTANARIFALRFENHRPLVIALDGQPATPHEPPGNVITLPPAGRADLILDLGQDPGSRHAVMDVYDPRRAFRFLELVYGDQAPLRAAPPDGPLALAPNPLPEPDLGEAESHEILLAGGAMGGLQSAVLEGQNLDIGQLARRGKVWAVNGIVADGNDMDPLLRFQRGRSQVLRIRNDSAFPHPMHLHGHSFRLLARGGVPAPHLPWLDTVLVDPEETVEVAFVADNPGDWLFHCHVLEHMEAGMAAVFRVA